MIIYSNLACGMETCIHINIIHIISLDFLTFYSNRAISAINCNFIQIKVGNTGEPCRSSFYIYYIT